MHTLKYSWDAVRAHYVDKIYDAERIHIFVMLKKYLLLNKAQMTVMLNKLAKLGDAIAISKSEAINDSLTH